MSIRHILNVKTTTEVKRRIIEDNKIYLSANGASVIISLNDWNLYNLNAVVKTA